MSNTCKLCKCNIPYNVYNYSNANFSIPLCINCQDYIRYSPSTNETLALFIELVRKGVPAELEKFDGYKHIDIAIVEARINIEVDGSQHNLDNYQAIADLRRTYHSMCKGFYTIRVPNSAVKYHLEETADLVVGIINEHSKNKIIY